jgi:hypothetical protein
MYLNLIPRATTPTDTSVILLHFCGVETHWPKRGERAGSYYTPNTTNTALPTLDVLNTPPPRWGLRKNHMYLNLIPRATTPTDTSVILLHFCGVETHWPKRGERAGSYYTPNTTNTALPTLDDQKTH